MDEEQKQVQTSIKTSAKKLIKIVVITIIVGFFLVGCHYVNNTDDYEAVSERNSAYTTVVNSSGQIEYREVNDDGTVGDQVTIEQMTQDFREILKGYIDYETEEELNEKIEYLINAETVTKLPYIEPTGESVEGEPVEGESEEPLVGRIKFYRYASEEESNNAYLEQVDEYGNKILNDSYRLTYIPLEEFEAGKANYESGGNTDVFNHFTIDEEGQVIIACGTKETRSVITEDTDITEQMVEEASGEDYSDNGGNDFGMVKYTISERTIDYLSLTEVYTMPSNLLYAFLITTQDIDFVEQLANLAYESEIAIGIFDNDSTSYTNETITYNKTMNMTVSTNLNFDELSTTAPAITKNRLYSYPYSRIPSYCYANTSGKQHNLNYFNTSNTPTVSNFQYNEYITGTNNNNQIRGLGNEENANEYEINFSKTITSNSVSTYGVILADTWIARWTATYISEDAGQEPLTTTSTYDDAVIVEYSTTEDVLNAFATSMTRNIESQLAKHAEELEKSAEDRIIECSEALLEAEQTTVEDILQDANRRQQLLQLLENHIERCTRCSNDIDDWWVERNASNNSRQANTISTLNISSDVKVQQIAIEIPDLDHSGGGNSGNTGNEEAEVETPPIEEIIEEIYNTINRGALSNVSSHFRNAIQQNIVNDTNNNIEERFEEEVREGITLEEQYLTGYKEDTNINYSYTTSRDAIKYEKDSETGRDNEGEKFSEIYNNIEFHNSIGVFNTYIGWFWDCIRASEDTAKLEDVLRYLLNIATGTNNYGTFSPEQIEELFSVFEPKQYISTSSAGSISPYGCVLTREEFIAEAQSYNGGSSYHILADAAGDFYDICTSEQYNINPCLAYAWACLETGYGDSIPYNNLFGMGVYNGASSGRRYSSYADSIEDFCVWVIEKAASSATINRAEEYATVNSKFAGGPESSIYALFSTYMYLGDMHFCNEPDFNNPAGIDYYKENGSTWGRGGRIYIYYMYEKRRTV